MATQHQTTPTPKRGRGRPSVAVKHKPCAFTFTVPADALLELQKQGISREKAMRLARQAANAAIQHFISQQQNSI
jgi:hypothetical protein